MVHTQKYLTWFSPTKKALFDSISLLIFFDISFSLLTIKSKAGYITFIHLIGQVPSKHIHMFMRHMNICHSSLSSYYVFLICPLSLELFSIWLVAFGLLSLPPCWRRSSKTENLSPCFKHNFSKRDKSKDFLPEPNVCPSVLFLIPCDFSV